MNSKIREMNARALFLDRDGVINVDKGYVYKIEDFEFISGIFELSRAAVSSGLKLIVVTNQSGIGRGFYTEKQFIDINEWMKNKFEKELAPIDSVYYCPYHPEKGIGHYKRNSFNRKPNPGMLLQARHDFSLNMQESLLIGDSERDIDAGLRAGVGVNIILGSKLQNTKASHVFDNLGQIQKNFFPENNKL